MKTNRNDAARLSRIARRITAGYGNGHYIESDLTEWGQEQLKAALVKVSNKYGWLTDIIETGSHSGKSFDGYLSNTSGDCYAYTRLDTWSLYDLGGEFTKEYDSMQESMRSSFTFDCSNLFDEREIDGYGVLEDLDEKGKLRLVDDELNCPDDIRDEYENYEQEWMGNFVHTLVIEMQFRRKGNSLSFDRESGAEWTAAVFVYLADEYMRNKKYVFEKYIDFNPDEDPRKDLEQAVNEAAASL